MTVMVVVGRGGVGKLGWLSWRCLGGSGREHREGATKWAAL